MGERFGVKRKSSGIAAGAWFSSHSTPREGRGGEDGAEVDANI